MEQIEFECYLNQSELKGLDFKREQYGLDNNRAKSKLIKDILAMANTIQPQGDKHIILGVYYHKGSKEIVGIKESRDDEEFQSIIRDKVYPIPDFLYEEVPYEGKQFGVITIYERENRPYKPIRDFGVLKKGEVYIRRGSKNDIATAEEVTEIHLSSLDETLRDVLEPIRESTRMEIKETCVLPKQCETAVKILQQKHLLILLGPPHIGKTFVGQHLLMQLKEGNLIREVFKLSRYREPWRLDSLEGYGILMDDPFGGTEYRDPDIGEHFDDIINLSKSNNFVVITSRSSVFDEARQHTKMGEKPLDDHIFELKEESYTEEELKSILEKHLDYSFSVEKEITKDKYEFARLSQKAIVSALRFPHNIERLVSLLKQKDALELDSLIDEARAIGRAAGLWFHRLEKEEEKYFVFAVVLFNGRFHEESFKPILEDIFFALRINKPVWLRELRRATRSYITEDRKIVFKHEGYLQGVLERIREASYADYEDRLVALSSVFESLVENQDPYVRLSATSPIGELAHIDPEKAFSLTARLLRDKDSTVREYAIFPLKEIAKVDYDKVSQLVGELSVMGGSIQKQQIAFLFKEIRHERLNEAVSTLERLIKEKMTIVWRAAAYGLAAIGKEYPSRVLPIMNQLAASRDIRLRQAAAICVREIGKVEFSDEVKSVVSELVQDKERRVRYRALRTLIEIGYERPKEILALAIEWSSDNKPRLREISAQILGEIGIFLNKVIAISTLESLTEDEDVSVRNIANSNLKKIKREELYTFEELTTQLQSLIEVDRGKISETLVGLREKSLAEDFNRAMEEVFIRQHVLNGDAQGLEETIASFSVPAHRYPDRVSLLRLAFKAIYCLYEQNDQEALSFILKWYQINKANTMDSFYAAHGTRFSGSRIQFISLCCKEICKKSGCDEVLEHLDKWIQVETRSPDRKRTFARLIVSTLTEIGTDSIDPVIDLLQKWAEVGSHHQLQVATTTLIEITRSEQNKDRANQLLRHLLDEDNDATRSSIFYTFSQVGEGEPEKVLPVLKDLASHNKPVVRQNVSTALGKIGQTHPEVTLNTLREWINDRELMNLKTVPHALRAISRNERSHEVLAALVKWTEESKNEDVHRVVEDSYEELEKEFPKEELEKKRKEVIEEAIREEVGIREEKVDIIEIKELPLLSYLSKVETGRPLEKYVVILLQHLLGDFARSIPSLERVGISPENALILGIPYSTKSSVVSYLREKGYLVFAPCDYPFTEDVNKIIKESLERVKEKSGKILIVEDGGYIVPRLHEEHLDSIAWFKGAVEQTANGIWRDRELETTKILRIPVMNVAECTLKQLIESPLVGEAVVRNLANLFAKMGKGIGGKEILVVGYGNIGKQVADTLKRNKAITYVYDFDKIRLLQARNDGHITRESLPEAVPNKFAIIGGTGREVISRDIILLLDHNTYLINATSKRVEINIDELNALTVTNGVSEIGGGAAQVHKLINEKNVILMAKGFPVNFYGEAESIPDEDIQFVPGLLFKGVLELAENEFEPGIHDIPEKVRQEIASLQLKLQT